MNDLENDAPSYEELVLELARQVKFNEVDENQTTFDDIPEEVGFSQEVDGKKISFEDISEEDTIKYKGLSCKNFWTYGFKYKDYSRC